jgi:hypothetical protein
MALIIYNRYLEERIEEIGAAQGLVHIGGNGFIIASRRAS